MTFSPLEEAWARVRSASASLQLATQAGRAELEAAGHVSDATWELADHLAGELELQLGHLELVERIWRTLPAASGGGGRV